MFQRITEKANVAMLYFQSPVFPELTVKFAGGVRGRGSVASRRFGMEVLAHCLLPRQKGSNAFPWLSVKDTPNKVA